MSYWIWLVAVIILIFGTRLYLKLSCRPCLSQASMKGKVIIVTGANTGIGFEMAKDLARRGGRVVLACRDQRKGLAAQEAIIEQTRNNDVVYKHLNLSSLDSVRKFAEEFSRSEASLDVLINNAGVHGLGERYTRDGILEGPQINHFAPFLLTLLLLPLLKETKGRVVTVSSIMHFLGEVKLDKINKAGCYNDTFTYCNGKLCNILFTVELARRVAPWGVTVTALHPGQVLTGITGQARWDTRILFALWCWLCCRTAVQGAQTALHLAVAEECAGAGTTGRYYVDCRQMFMTWKARNRAFLKKFWEFSEELVGYSADKMFLE